ncbi:MAG: hypothetical protein ACJ8GN_20310 [Longimicrobiaceae bacterium]
MVVVLRDGTERRYITPVVRAIHMDAAAEFLGLDRLHLKAG